MQTIKASLTEEVNRLTRTKQILEGVNKTEKAVVEQTLARFLVSLKQQNPELFYMNEQEQRNHLINVIMKAIFSIR